MTRDRDLSLSMRSGASLLALVCVLAPATARATDHPICCFDMLCVEGTCQSPD
jgi:hypothetical protein